MTNSFILMTTEMATPATIITDMPSDATDDILPTTQAQLIEPHEHVEGSRLLTFYKIITNLLTFYKMMTYIFFHYSHVNTTTGIYRDANPIKDRYDC